jgi:hypothetical protein
MAVSASARVTAALDNLATALNAPNTALTASRDFQRLQPDASGRDGEREAHWQASLPSPSAQVTQVEDLLHSLQISNPAMLTRAIAIDQASHQLLAEASAKSLKRDELTADPPRPIRKTPAHPAKVASNDLPRHTPGHHQLTHDRASTAPAPAILPPPKRATEPHTYGARRPRPA